MHNLQKVDGKEIGQSHYLENLLQKFGMAYCKSCSTPSSNIIDVWL